MKKPAPKSSPKNINAKKTVPKKATLEKTTAKKVTTKKTNPKEATPEKVVVKKAAPKKTTTKKVVLKKPAQKKQTTLKKTTKTTKTQPSNATTIKPKAKGIATKKTPYKATNPPTKALGLKIKQLILYSIVIFVFVMSWVIFQKILNENVASIDFSIYESKQQQNAFQKNPIELFFTIVLVTPILEELVFRTLIKPNKSDLLLFPCGVIGLALVLTVGSQFTWYYTYAGIGILMIGLFFLLKSKLFEKKFLLQTSKFLQKKGIMITLLIVSSLLFGVSHALNYGTLSEINLVILLLTIPRIFSGSIYGIFKIKNGITWSIGLHALRNLIPFLISII